MKKTVYAIAVGIGLIASSVVYATNMNQQQHAAQQDDTRIIVVAGPGIERLKDSLKKLDLTSEQQEKVRQIIQDAEPEFADNMREAEQNSTDLRELCGKDYDESKIADLADAQGELVAKTIKLRLKVRHQIYELLTPDQRVKIEKWKQANLSNND